MKERTLKEIIGRWRQDYDFRTRMNAAGSMLATLAFALYNGFLGIAHGSVWHGSICIYYLVLILIRGMALFAEYRAAGVPDRERRRQAVSVICAVLLFLLNLCMTAPMAFMVKLQKPVHMTLIPAIAMAAYTTWKLTLASVHLRKRRTSLNPLVRLLRTVSFVDALMSLATLQNTLIMVNNKDAPSMLLLTAVSTGCMWAGSVFLSAMAMWETRKHRKEAGGRQEEKQTGIRRKDR